VSLAVPADRASGGGVGVARLASGDVRLADLAGETWVAGCERCRSHLLQACRAAGVEPRIAYATDDYMAVQRLVARGLAIAALPGLAFGLHREPGVARLSAPELGYRRITAVVPAGPRPPAVTAMLDRLVAVTAAEAGVV
jgi:DNA-binding transcriptional LysR family regulator